MFNIIGLGLQSSEDVFLHPVIVSVFVHTGYMGTIVTCLLVFLVLSAILLYLWTLVMNMVRIIVTTEGVFIRKACDIFI